MEGHASFGTGAAQTGTGSVVWCLLAAAGHQPVPELGSEAELPHPPLGRGLLWPQGISPCGGTGQCGTKLSLVMAGASLD